MTLSQGLQHCAFTPPGVGVFYAALSASLFLMLSHVGARRRGKKRSRVRVLRVGEHRIPGPVFDRFAEIHHHHLVGDIAHHRKVMADEDIGEAELFLQIRQKVQHLRLHREIERGTGSSSTSRRGLSISARAMAMRWRWPPENMCG